MNTELTLSEMEEPSEGGDDVSLGELFKTLMVNEDIILVIDSESEDLLRKGLIAMKYKANKSVKDAGVDVDGRTMEFKLIPWTEKEKMEDRDCNTKTKIQIYLKARSAIKVHQLIITDKEF